MGAREYTQLFLEIDGLLLVKALFIQLLIHSWQVRGKHGVPPPTHVRVEGKQGPGERHHIQIPEHVFAEMKYHV